MKIPRATYRLQFHREFPFAAAHQIVDYLAGLGISDIYASPIFKAKAESTHGYDVADPNQLNPELGTPEQFAALVSSVQAHQMGWLQDIVPNHMAYDSANAYLMDLFENGPDAESFDFFDIDWDHAYESLKGRVLAPLLGNFYNESLDNGDLQLKYEETGLQLLYGSQQFPIRLESYGRFITQNLGQLTKTLGRHHPDLIKLLGILYLIKHIPEETKGRERDDQLNFVKGLLWELYTQNEAVKRYWDDTIAFFNGNNHQCEPLNALDLLLSEQFYRLAFWKVGTEEINYRRFFTVNELISVKVEDIRVFHKTHALIAELVAQGSVTGLRVDHIDGLYDPLQYLERLTEKALDTYITVEKILELHEDLPETWPIQGTSGYDFLNYVNGIFCQTCHEDQLQESYFQFTRMTESFQDLVRQKKRLILEKNLLGDVDNLVRKLKLISARTRAGSDFTTQGLMQALTEVLVQFPVYRTYIDPHQQVSPADCEYIKQAIANASAALPLAHRELAYIERLLIPSDEAPLASVPEEERLNFVMKFQQLTGPLMAKGMEDTSLYIYARLLSLNEVGGNPGQFGISLDSFHHFNHHRSVCWPHTQNATATHDTKRGEDVRSRLNVLSEMPQAWHEQAMAWQQINDIHKVKLNNGQLAPSRNDEYFLYQTLLGAYPFTEAEQPEFIERVKQYTLKAIREAKLHTTWLQPNAEYEEGCMAFITALFKSDAFLEAFKPFQSRIASYGIFNSLSQVLLKATAPGAPDFYQGTELWDLSLVDPDNRRPVDYAHRISLLAKLQHQFSSNPLELISELLATPQDGRIKFFLTLQLLQARQRYCDLFCEGNYEPLKVSGKFADCVVAFARTHQDQLAIALVPRFLTTLIEPDQLPLTTTVWQDTHISLPDSIGSTWTNLITGETGQFEGHLCVGQAFQHFPGALLLAQREG